MFIQIFTLPFDPVVGGFDDGPLQDFIKDKELFSVRDHFFIKDGRPYLILILTYHPTRPDDPAAGVATRSKKDQSWRELLTEADWPLFNALREWRSERCKRDGVPPYVICTNRQLAAMTTARPQSLNQLARIDGFGKAKLDKYGQEILAILATQPVPAEESQETSANSNDHGEPQHESTSR